MCRTATDSPVVCTPIIGGALLKPVTGASLNPVAAAAAAAGAATLPSGSTSKPAYLQSFVSETMVCRILALCLRCSIPHKIKSSSPNVLCA